MRSPSLAGLLLALFASAAVARTAAAQADFADGLVAGDYLRVSGGIMSPVHPQGSLRDWDRGNTIAVVWENWGGGQGSAPGLVGFGLSADYGRLPLNETEFLAHFTPASGGSATSASASSASLFTIETTLRVRIPAPYIMPSVSIGFGYVNFHPSSIQYVTPTSTGTSSEQHRSGAVFTFGAGLDKRVASRFGVFGEALYSYGLTSLGQGIANPGGTCAANGCDVLKNTTVGMLRGGLRYQLSR